jgi:lysophospholipase L1-like esterase
MALGFVVLSGLAATLATWWRVASNVPGELRANPWFERVAWGAAFACFVTVIRARAIVEFWEGYYAVIAWLIAGSFTAGHSLMRRVSSVVWLKRFAMVWAIGGAIVWLGAAYLQDRAQAFYFGALVLLGLLVATRIRFKIAPSGIQMINTVILLIVVAPLANWLLVHPLLRLSALPGERGYSYQVGRHHPARFVAWWKQYQDAWNIMARDVFMPDPDGKFWFRLRPKSEGRLLRSRVVINSRGFRGREIPEEKGDAYRIVALGESTTFGCTLESEDRPWPEVLEDLIRERLLPSRPVEVINAGVPAYDLADSTLRFESEIAALKPDLVVSYHGYNGLAMLRDVMPPTAGGLAPAYKRRPLALLAILEYRLKWLWHRGLNDEVPRADVPPPELLLECEYARRYRELIGLTRTHGIQLALCTFPMAVNRDSPNDVIEFYRPAFPSIRWQIEANVFHSAIVRQLGQRYPEVEVVDVQARLDGSHERFIDLVHLTQDGRQLVAETVFNELRDLLARELGNVQRGSVTQRGSLMTP